MKRKCSFVVRLTEDELHELDKKVKSTGMSREAYIRTVLNGFAPISLPPTDYYSLIREVRAVGNNLHQISYRAHSMNLLDAPSYRKNADRVTKICDDLMAVCVPRKID